MSLKATQSHIVKTHKRRAEIFTEAAHSSSRLIGRDDKTSQDEKLAQLTMGVGLAAQVFSNPLAVEERLIQILGFCIGWLESMGEKHAFDLVIAERVRQHTLFAAGRIIFNCNSPVVDPKRKLRILVEELGEVAQALDKLERSIHAHQEVKTEITHVAAVAMAWLETPEVKS